MGLKNWLSCVIALCVIVPAAHATTDELALGRYTYVSKDFRIDMLLDSDGMKQVRINGHRYPGTYDAGFTGSPQDTYSFTIEDGKILRTIRLDILWGTEYEVLAAVCFYTEREKASKPELDNKLLRVRVFKAKFHHIDLEKLPSMREPVPSTASPTPQP